MTTELKENTEIKEAKNKLVVEIENTLMDRLGELPTNKTTFTDGGAFSFFIDTLVQIERVYDCVSEVFDSYIE